MDQVQVVEGCLFTFYIIVDSRPAGWRLGGLRSADGRAQRYRRIPSSDPAVTRDFKLKFHSNKINKIKCKNQNDLSDILYSSEAPVSGFGRGLTVFKS